MTVPIHHVITADAAAFWDMFFDTPRARDFFLRGLGYLQFDVLTYEEDEHHIRRTAQCHPHLVLPRPIASLFGGGFRYKEIGTFDKRSTTWTFSWIPHTFESRIVLDGSMRTQDRPQHPGSCDRFTEMTVVARFPGIGGLLERQTARLLREQWDRSAAVNNEWLANIES